VGGGGGNFQYIDPGVQGKVTPLREGTAAASVSVDRSCVWSLGQMPAPRSRDWLFALGSGAVQVRRLSSDDQADMVKVCSHQLSAAPVTGTVYRPVPFNNNFISGTRYRYRYMWFDT
jgi:hypothetical protein